MIPVSEGLRAAMARHGLTPPSMMKADGFTRFPGMDKGKSNKAGWVNSRPDGSAVFGDHSRGLSECYQPSCHSPLTRQQLDALKRERAEHKTQAEAVRRAAEERTAERARSLWNDAGAAAENHPYLTSKGVTGRGIGQRGDMLMVPLVDPADGTLWNIQWIAPNGVKRFMRDGRTKGLCVMVDNAHDAPDGAVLICEGYATAASCQIATGHPTVCAFSAGNLLPVAKAMRAKYSKARIIIAGDHDASGTGQRAALEAACAVGGSLAIPAKEGMDWNDVHAAEGLDAVRVGIESAKVPDGAGTDGEEAAAQRAVASGPAPWPAALDEAAYHGILGEIVRMIEPQTEADPMAILLQAIVTFGATVGRGPHVRVEGDEHHAALYAVIVGESSKARKGTSAGRIREVFSRSKYRLESVEGLSSGEGLKYHVRDEHEELQLTDKKTGKREMVLVDPGVTDKRLLVVESEFSQAQRQTARSGNTLSATVRSAWDTGNLRTLTKNDPIIATGAHICIVGHITIPELRAELTQTDTANGFANRFLFALVKRSKLLPFGGEPMDPSTLSDLGSRIDAAIEHARDLRAVGMTDAARSVWAAIYADLSQGRPGLLGAVTARAEAQTLRMALVYALAECAAAIDTPHLMAALAVTKYVQESATYIFGDSLGDPVADELLAALQRAGDAGLSRNDICNLLGRHQRAERINAALDLLLSRGLATKATVPTKGRPSEVWRAARKAREAREASKGDAA